MGERDTMKKTKVIKVWTSAHLEVRIHASEEMVKDFKNCQKGCSECSWYDVTIDETPVCWLADFRKHIKRQLEK